MEWWKAERESTNPSTRVTVTQTSRPSPRAPNIRLAADGEPDVADKAFVEDGVDPGLVVNAALWEAANGSASGGRKRVHDISTVAECVRTRRHRTVGQRAPA